MNNKFNTWFFVIILFGVACKSGRVDSKKNINITFEIENQGKQDICNNFSIDFLTSDNTYKGTVEDCKIILPNFPKELESLKVVFSYNEYKMIFDNVELNLMMINQDMNWNFRIDYPPFEESNNDSLEVNNLKKIHYFQFNPLEEGEGIEIINPIYN
tara:strand:+ start:932 stop:1402 length:471 start_codon:yes stop_codon:yes gene_type:complete